MNIKNIYIDISMHLHNFYFTTIITVFVGILKLNYSNFFCLFYPIAVYSNDSRYFPVRYY